MYTASATATGDGRNGRTRTSDGVLDVALVSPVAMGGAGGATNPEQLFAAGYSACFISAIKLVASQQKISISDVAVTAEVALGPNDNGGYELGVALHVELSGLDQAAAEALVADADRICPYSNATRGNVELTVDTITG